MENASKALLIAGSVLLTLIVLAIFIYFFTQFHEFPEQQQEAIKQEQIAKFNREYESYNKQKMYGVDVVTVMNKVISNNERYADKISGRYLLEDNNYFIDVEVTLLSDVISYATQYIEVEDSNGLIDTKTYNKGTIKGLVNGKKGQEKTFELGKVFDSKKIKLLEETSFEYFMNNDIEKFFSDAETYKIKLTSGGDVVDKYDEFNYTLVYSGFTDFKRKLFSCTGVEYNPETARVSKIYFKEIPEEDR